MRDTDPGGAFSDPDNVPGAHSFVQASAYEHAMAERNASRREVAGLRAALQDACEVFALVYSQLSDLDRAQDCVERSRDAANELHHALARANAVLGSGGKR